jgi:uncharacterized membrane protein YqjE
MENSGSASIHNITGKIRDYIETRIDIVKLETVESGASAVSSMMSWLIILLVGFLIVLTLTVGLAIGIGYLMENFAIGFFIVTAVYLVAGIIVYSYREKWLRKPFSNVIIKNIYDNE